MNLMRIIQVVGKAGGSAAPPTKLRTVNVNITQFGNSVTDPAWNNTNNTTAAGIIATNMLDSTGAATTWDLRTTTGVAGENSAGGTSEQDALLGVPTGVTARGRKNSGAGVDFNVLIEGLDDSKQYEVVVYAYHQYSSRTYTAQLNAQAIHTITAGQNATLANLGKAAPVGGIITMYLVADTAQNIILNGMTINEYGSI